MGYMHIDNLYKDISILSFKECYALEKIHGTSAHISWNIENKEVILFSGGEKHAKFEKLFDKEELKRRFEMFFDLDIVLFGEAYGGKQQGMSDTYGKELKFIVFDVKVGDYWLSVPDAEEVAKKLDLEFVSYNKVEATIESLDYERDLNSIQALRNGIVQHKMREGVVLRPLMELRKNNGNRIIAKHKRDEFKETKTKREVNPESLKILEDAKAIAKEWVTPMRLTHVLDKLGNPTEIENIPQVIKAMIEDVCREGKDEIVESKATIKSISCATALLYKRKISKLNEVK